VFQSDCPGVFGIVSRILAETECDTVARDYEVAKSLGGNDEPGTTREQGVSFNPRLGRILSILIQDGHMHEVCVLRCALYASISPAETQLRENVPAELQELVIQARGPSPASHVARAIQLAWALDDVRHLHMSDLSLAERLRMLQEYEEALHMHELPGVLEPLVVKLRHALTLQRRRLAFDRRADDSEGGER
jgi:hypothetical protein